MKKFKIGLIILSIVFNVGIAKADTITIPAEYSLSYYSSNIDTNTYNEIIQEWQTNYSKTYPYYIMAFGNNNQLVLYGVKHSSDINYSSDTNITSINIIRSEILIIKYYDNEIHTNVNTDNGYQMNVLEYNNNGYTSEYYEYEYYDSNVSLNFLLSDFSYDEINITGFYSDTITLSDNQSIPKLKDLIQYNSWSDYENNHLEGYTEVNLDNYEYVLLTLKNYNQTQAFQTNLQVKGQIGITPIYNYGQTSKDAVTGVQVQDRCNISYENYTSYPFYIIQTDLQNNVIYAVKECSEGSSFKFDSSIFNITYVTTENEENPTVTINGKTYDVIPYDDLPSTATKNEEDNYIPGESGSATDTGGLDSAIAGTQSKLSEIWNTFTYFTSFIGLIFSSLPSEVHTILLSAFTIMIVLGIIKIFLGK